jgi:MFS family permease
MITGALMLGVYAIVTAADQGWTSIHTLGFGGASLALITLFVALQARLRNPLMPLRILRLRSLTGASAARAFLVAGMFTNFFIGALYLQHVKGFSAFTTGLAFLPTTLMLGVLSAGITARLMARFGPRNLLLAGLVTIGSGLLLLAGANEQASYFPRIFVAYLLLGIGGGTSFMPLLTISMSEVPSADAGLASGFGNVTMQVGGAIGLASLGTISTGHAKALAAQGESFQAALAGGYQLGFLLAAASVAIALAVAVIALRSSHGRQRHESLAPEDDDRELAA